MSLLSLIQDAATIIGIARPNSVIGSTTRDVIELLAFAQEEGRALVKVFDWQELTKEKTFTTIAAETQSNAIPDDFDRFIDETFWNRSKSRRLYGPLSSREWQQIKGTNGVPTMDNFTYRGSNILITPTTAAGETMAFEYISNKWCESSGGTAQTAWAADTDTGILDEELMKLGVIVRFKSSKGLAFDTDLEKYRQHFILLTKGNRPKRTAHFGADKKISFVNTPESSWPL